MRRRLFILLAIYTSDLTTCHRSAQLNGSVVLSCRGGGAAFNEVLANSSCDVRVRYRGNDTTPERVLRAVRHDDHASRRYQIFQLGKDAHP